MASFLASQILGLSTLNLVIIIALVVLIIVLLIIRKRQA